MSESYLAQGLPQPMPSPDGLDQRYWEGLKDEQIYLQRCNACQGCNGVPSGRATIV